MTNKKTINIIAISVILISVFCCVVPFVTKSELADKTVISSFGETITFYGKGLYARNSFSGAIQAIAQDLVTLIIVVPGMICALFLIKRNQIVGDFLLAGLFGYFFYTYMSYTFLMAYNDLFLLYVADMTLSFYGLVLSIFSLSNNVSVENIREKMPVKGLRIFLICSGIAIFMMWIGRIVPTIGKDVAPAGLDNCTTLVIQGMDLGIIVPACFVIAHLLKIKHKLGYILGPVIIVKAVTLVTAVFAMAVYMKASGIEVAAAEFIVFGIMCVLSIFYFVRIMRQITRY